MVVYKPHRVRCIMGSKCKRNCLIVFRMGGMFLTNRKINLR